LRIALLVDFCPKSEPTVRRILRSG